jgi:hypothetical protein
LLLAIVICVSSPIGALASDVVEINIANPPAAGEGFVLDPQHAVLTITKNGEYRIYGATKKRRVEIAPEIIATITLSGVNIDSTLYRGASSINVNRAALTLLLSGENRLQSLGGPAINLTDGSRLTIDSAEASGSSSGALSASGFSCIGADSTSHYITIDGGTVTASGSGVGIGASRYSAKASVTINGGVVTAKGGGTYAGISGGGGGSVTINGGVVTAIGGSNSNDTWGGAGIGGSSGVTGGSITINGGVITATGGGLDAPNGMAAGIGCGSGTRDGLGNIIITGGTITTGLIRPGRGGWVSSVGATITGGSVKASIIEPYAANGGGKVYLSTLTLESDTGVAVAGAPVTDGVIGGSHCAQTPDESQGVYGIEDVVTDSEGKVYFYLPATSGPERLALTADGRNYGSFFKREAKNGNSATLTPIMDDIDEYDPAAGGSGGGDEATGGGGGCDTGAGAGALAAMAALAVPTRVWRAKKQGVSEQRTPAAAQRSFIERFSETVKRMGGMKNFSSSARKVRAILFVMVLICAAAAQTAYTAEQIDIANPSEGGDGFFFDFDDDVLHITGDGEYLLTGATSYIQLRIDDGVTATVILSGVSVDLSGVTASKYACPLEIGKASAVTLLLSGENTIKAGTERAGIEAAAGARLLIDSMAVSGSSDGVLAVAATGGVQAVISGDDVTIAGGAVTVTGGQRAVSGGNITITGGAVTATGGQQAVFGGNIAITGGEVTAAGGQQAILGGSVTFWGQAIYDGSVTISGGEVTANGGYGGAAISGGSVTITEGIITTVGSRGIYSEGGSVDISGGEVKCTDFGYAIYADAVSISGGSVSAITPVSGAAITIGIRSVNKDKGVSISGGTVSIYSWYGIECWGQLTISGGTITIAAKAEGRGIYLPNDERHLKIIGGSVKVSSISGFHNWRYLSTLTLESDTGVAIAGAPVTDGIIGGARCAQTPDESQGVYGIEDVVTDSEGKVYFYLPATSGPERLALTAGGRNYGSFFKREAKDGNSATLTPIMDDIDEYDPAAGGSGGGDEATGGGGGCDAGAGALGALAALAALARAWRAKEPLI